MTNPFKVGDIVKFRPKEEYFDTPDSYRTSNKAIFPELFDKPLKVIEVTTAYIKTDQIDIRYFYQRFVLWEKAPKNNGFAKFAREKLK